MQPNKELLLLDKMLTKVVNRVTLIPATMLQEMLDEFHCCPHNGTFIELLLSSKSPGDSSVWGLPSQSQLWTRSLLMSVWTLFLYPEDEPRLKWLIRLQISEYNTESIRLE